MKQGKRILGTVDKKRSNDIYYVKRSFGGINNHKDLLFVPDEKKFKEMMVSSYSKHRNRRLMKESRMSFGQKFERTNNDQQITEELREAYDFGAVDNAPKRKKRDSEERVPRKRFVKSNSSSIHHEVGSICGMYMTPEMSLEDYEQLMNVYMYK